FIGSGVRYDILLQETNNASLRKDHEAYTKTLIQNHVSGRLKVAPEHTSDSVLRLMRKPAFSLFYDFKTIFERESDLVGKKQQIIPYFISSHPGCTEADMASLALETKQLGFKLEQVQDFTPTPLTIATEMYYAETLPNGTPIYIAKKPEQKKNQQRFFFWYIRENRPWIKETLERLKLGKISRLLLSRSSLEEGRTYFPSQEAPSSKPTSPRPSSPKSFSQNSASQRSASPKASFPKNSSHKQSFQNNKKSRSPYRRNSKSS
ncbi:MAG TPA: YgiQ family radical SAM protein, partial [Fibrobacteraceae bacterium]|nr:YgiQ family radical SAM protein [Fibrobacteraceae bacterium]